MRIIRWRRGKKEAGKEAAASDEDIEVWGTNTGYLPVEAGSELYNLYKEKIGVGIVQPYVEWNGGETYLEQLNLRIAAGDMPDMFSPYNGIESELIESGALLDLTDLLPEKGASSVGKCSGRSVGCCQSE